MSAKIYNDYNRIYGNIESFEEFEMLYVEALRYINVITDGRSEKLSDSETVIRCACRICKLLSDYNSDTAALGAVESETVDGYSVKYRSKTEVSEELNREIVRTCRMYLPQDMLYRGV